MKREQFVFGRCNWNVYYLHSLLHPISFWFLLQTILW